MFEDFSDLLTIEDLMDVLLIGKNSAYNLINSGELASFRIGKKHKILKSSVIDYIIKKNSGELKKYD